MSGIFSARLPYKVYCNLPDCNKLINLVFKINIDGNQIIACSPDHARLGEERWNEKLRLNIKPGQTIIEKPDLVGDNLQELDEGGE